MPHPNAKLPMQSREAESGPEREPELDYFVRRLHLLGADAEEVDAVVAHWDDLDEDWTVEKRSTLVGASDTVVLAELARIRDEYPYQPEPAPPAPPLAESGVVMGVDLADGATGPQEGSDDGNGANGAENEDGAAGGTTAPDAWTPPADASVPALLREVGEDAERARIALAAEQASSEPRKTLLKALRKLTGA